MPPRTPDQCREKISEMIREAVVEDDAARREGLLTLADQWVEIAARRKRGGRVTDPFCPPGRPCPPGKCDED